MNKEIKQETKQRKANIKGVETFIRKQLGLKEGRNFIDRISARQDYILDVSNPKTILVNGSQKTFYQMIAIRDFEVWSIKIKKGQKGAWLEEGAKIGKGCWADDESIVYAEGTIIVNDSYVKNSRIFNGVVLDNTFVSNSKLTCFNPQESLSFCFCSVISSNIRVMEKTTFKECFFNETNITNDVPSASCENFYNYNNSDGLDFFGSID